MPQGHLRARDPNAVHDLRVAIRRFTQALRAFETYFRGKESRKMRRQLKRIMIPAGEVRNHDVALQILARSRLDASNLISSLQKRRKESEILLVSLLKRWMERKTSSKWRAVLEAPLAPMGAVSTAIEKTAQHTLTRMAKDFFAHGGEVSQAAASPEKLHQFRIAAKKFRYALEVFAPLYGPSLGEWLAAIRRAQTLLGEVNDCVIVREMISRHHDGKRLASRLKKRQYKKMDEFRRHWREAFGDRQQVRTWIHYLNTGAGKPRELKKPAARTASASRTGNRRGPAVA